MPKPKENPLNQEDMMYMYFMMNGKQYSNSTDLKQDNIKQALKELQIMSLRNYLELKVK